MAIHDLEVRIGWGTAATAADEVLLLDDATYGKLDSNVLGLPYGTKHVPADITSFVQGAQWSRGRRNEFEEVRAGSVSVQVIDETANFDPLNTSSTYTPSMGAPVLLTYGATPIGEFFVTDFDATHRINVNAVPWNISGVDRIAVLAGAELDTIASSYGGDATGARVDRVLDATEVAWGGRRDVETGQSTVGATTWGESALAHVQAMARSERGRAFIDRDGKLVFQSRHTNPNAAPRCTFTDDATPSDPDGDAGPAIRYAELTQASESELFWNRATVTDSADTVYTASDQTSKDDVGMWRTLTVDTENNSAAEAQAFADDIVARHADSGRSVYSSVTVDVRRLQDESAAKLAVLLDLDIGDRVKVVRTTPGASEGSVTHTIEGISGAASLESVRITFALAEDSDAAVFVLNNAVFGVLDTGPGKLAI